MLKDYLKIMGGIALAAIIALVINILIYQFTPLGGQEAHFVYPVPFLYVFFFIFAAVMLGILMRVHAASPAQTGYVFLFLTIAQLAAAYLMARPIVSKTIEQSAEKANFFIVFLLFLAIEAYYTARLLNKK